MDSVEMDIYTEWTDETVVYDESVLNFLEKDEGQQAEFLRLLYVSTALSGEVGELLNIVKKAFRNRAGELTEEDTAAIKDECGDIFYYFMRFMVEMGLDPVDVMAHNKRKLNQRRQEGNLLHQKTLPGLDTSEEVVYNEEDVLEE